HVPAALGTQTNGSIIRPAAFCGVVGFKPTRDTLPFAGIGVFSPTLDTLGVFARNVGDCALLASCLAEPGRIDGDLESLQRPPRLGYLAECPWTPVDPVQQRALETALNALQNAGARVSAVELPADWREAQLTHRTIMRYEGSVQLGDLQTRERDRMSAALNAALDEGRGMGEDAYRAALSRRDSLIAAASAWMAPFDAIVCAPAVGPAPADLAQTGDPSYCTLWTLLACPAISIPIGLTSQGLP